MGSLRLGAQPAAGRAGRAPVAADLLDPASLEAALADIAPTNVFITAWLRQDSEAENIRVNGAMVRNVLAALSPKKSVRHVALVTGLKHYLGPFEAYAKAGTLPETPLREEQPRLPIENFYYAQEDELYAAAARDGFSWNVHRPHTLIGKAVGNAMNMGTTLAVYASICKETGRPFQWPGSQAQWQGLSDVTDARQLARQLVWAADTKRRTTPPSTSSTAISSAGSGCGAGWRIGSASKRPASTAPFIRLRKPCGATRRYGATWPSATGWLKPTSVASPRPGTPTSIWAGRSK